MVTQQVSDVEQLCIGRVKRYESGTGPLNRALTEHGLTGNEAIRRMAHLSNLLSAEDMRTSVRVIGVIFGFPYRGADYLLREIGRESQLVIQGRGV